MSRGPIILALEIGELLLLVITLAVIIVAFVLIQHARGTAARDSCYLLRELVVKATPPGRQKAAIQYIDSTPLRDCKKYGGDVESGTTPK